MRRHTKVVVPIMNVESFLQKIVVVIVACALIFRRVLKYEISKQIITCRHSSKQPSLSKGGLNRLRHLSVTRVTFSSHLITTIYNILFDTFIFHAVHTWERFITYQIPSAFLFGLFMTARWQFFMSNRYFN